MSSDLLAGDLASAVRATSSVVTELENANAHGAKALRARVDLMTMASLQVRSLPDFQFEKQALEELAREIHHEAVELRRRHRIVQRSVLAMMD